MSESWRGDEIANRPNARLTGTTMFIDNNVAAIAHRYGSAIESEVFRKRTTTNRNNDHVDIKRLALSELHGCSASELGVVPLHRNTGAHCDVAILE